MRHSFAYLFERFPSFVQTFVYREAVEMMRQGANPWLVSVRQPDDPGEVAASIDAEHKNRKHELQAQPPRDRLKPDRAPIGRENVGQSENREKPENAGEPPHSVPLSRSLNDPVD